MKAVNLIPAESATGSGRSPVGVYALLGVLALLVAMSATYTLVARSVDTKRGELAGVTARAQSTESKATQYKRFTEFSQLRQSRVETVKKLAGSRFDWAEAMHEVARTMPTGSWVTSIRATVDPSAQVAGSADPLRAAIPAPAIELAGCAKTQQGVAGVVAALRGITGVQRVTLSSSVKQQATDDSGSASDSSGPQLTCGSTAQFSLTVFFTAPAGSTATSATTATTATASGASTP
jgi:Tfp pilus assembly protein PilN